MSRTLPHIAPGRELRIRELALADQPLYRIGQHGAPSLSDAELISIITGQSTLAPAYQLLTHTKGLAGLAAARPADLAGVVRGLGPVALARLTAAFDLSRRLLSPSRPEGVQIKAPADVAALCMLEMAALDQEHLRAIALDMKNHVQTVTTVYIGSLNTVSIRVGELFKEALRCNSAAIILVHNHPSGDPSPSPEDVLMTRMAHDAGKLLDVELLDHLIIGKGRFVSLRERGLGFAS